MRSALTAVAGTGDSLEPQLLMHLARTEESLGRHEPAYEHAMEARRLLEAAQDLPRLAAALRLLGGVVNDRREAGIPAPESPREILEQAHSIAVRVGNAEEIGASLINLSNTLSSEGLVEEAIECALESAAAFESVGLKGGIAAAYSNLAQYQMAAGRSEAGLEAAERAFEIAVEIGHPFWISGALNGIAQAQLALGRPGEALASAERAAEVAERSGLGERRRYALGFAAAAYRALGDEDRALELDEVAARIG
jgi:tetratricopeptide (TPR) repeat protein